MKDVHTCWDEIGLRLKEVLQQDPSLVEDAQRLRGMLADATRGSCGREIFAITVAQEQQLVSDIRRARTPITRKDIWRWATRLEDTCGFSGEVALKTVETWCNALGLEATVDPPPDDVTLLRWVNVGEPISALAAMPDRTFVVGTESGLYRYDQAGSLIWHRRPDPTPVIAALAPDHEEWKVYFAARDGTVGQISVDTGASETLFEGVERVNSLALCPQRKLLAVGHSHNAITVLDIEKQEIRWQKTGTRAHLWSVDVDSHNGHLYVGSGGTGGRNVLTVLALEDGSPMSSPMPCKGRVTGVRALSNGKGAVALVRTDQYSSTLWLFRHKGAAKQLYDTSYDIISAFTVGDVQQPSLVAVASGDNGRLQIFWLDAQAQMDLVMEYPLRNRVIYMSYANEMLVAALQNAERTVSVLEIIWESELDI